MFEARDVDADGRISRRRLLQLMGAGGVGLAAAACGVSTQTSPPTIVNAGDFKIPNSGARLPTEQATLRWMDSGDQKALFFNALFPAYSKKHPTIQVDYTGTNWNTIQQVILLGFQNNTAPDVFQLPLNVTAAQAVQSNWVGPLDDIVPDWPSVKKRFAPGVFANGITDFGGKTYGFPWTSNTRFNFAMLYDSDYMKKAGYDPSEKPLTWDQFRTALRKITQQGAGNYYGIIAGLTQSGQLSGVVDTLAQMAGAHGTGVVGGSFNYLTGHYNFTSDQYLAATELILAIKADGSFFPGSASIDAPGARGRFPQGVAGVIMQGPWNIPAWKKQNPSFPLGIALPPVQKSLNDAWPVAYGPGGSNTWFRSAASKLGPVIGDIFNYIATLNGQIQWAEYDGVGDPPQFPDAITHARVDALSRKEFNWASKWTVIAPEPAVRKPQIQDVYRAAKMPTPNWSDTMVGLFTGQITATPKAALQGVQDRYEGMLDDAIRVVNQRQGSHITRDDFVFKDWNPRQPYTKLYQSS